VYILDKLLSLCQQLLPTFLKVVLNRSQVGWYCAEVVGATLVAWGQYLAVNTLLSSTIPDTALWTGDSDMFVLGSLVAALAKLFGFLL
jgi:hypothetical protein